MQYFLEWFINFNDWCPLKDQRLKGKISGNNIMLVSSSVLSNSNDWLIWTIRFQALSGKISTETKNEFTFSKLTIEAFIIFFKVEERGTAENRSLSFLLHFRQIWTSCVFKNHLQRILSWMWKNPRLFYGFVHLY